MVSSWRLGCGCKFQMHVQRSVAELRVNGEKEAFPQRNCHVSFRSDSLR